MDFKEEVYKRIEEKMEGRIREISDDIIKDLAPERFPHGRFGTDIQTEISRLIASRFVAENYDKIAEQISIPTVVKMAELAAIGKTFQKDKY